VLATNASLLTNKYSEGYPGRRYYGGQQYNRSGRDTRHRARQASFPRRACQRAGVERIADESSVYFGLLEPGDTILAMD